MRTHFAAFSLAAIPLLLTGNKTGVNSISIRQSFMKHDNAFVVGNESDYAQSRTFSYDDNEEEGGVEEVDLNVGLLERGDPNAAANQKATSEKLAKNKIDEAAAEQQAEDDAAKEQAQRLEAKKIAAEAEEAKAKAEEEAKALAAKKAA